MRKYILLTLISIIILSGIAVYQYFNFYDGRLHVTFCDVGQGDSILIRTPHGKLILVDGGPDNKVLECLSSKMGFWERTIDMIILTHPHQDHYYGLNFVLDRFSVLSFASLNIINTVSSYNELSSNISNKSINKVHLFKNDRFKIGNDVEIIVLEPDIEMIERSSPNGVIGESSEFASTILHLKYKDFDLLLTGDSQTLALASAIDNIKEELDVLQVPHHGSATGFTRSMLNKTSPRIAVLSVGKNNRYGHPNKKIIDALNEEDIHIFRTDRQGSVEIISDGVKYWSD